MTDRAHRPAYALHALVALLDRSADEILPSLGLSYPRFLTLLTIERLGGDTQRAIATAMGVTEPAVSRTIRSLQDSGLVAAESTAGGGNRRAVGLTAAGQRLVDRAADQLEEAFSHALEAAGVTPSAVLAVTDPLLKVLSGVES